MAALRELDMSQLGSKLRHGSGRERGLRDFPLECDTSKMLVPCPLSSLVNRGLISPIRAGTALFPCPISARVPHPQMCSLTSAHREMSRLPTETKGHKVLHPDGASVLAGPLASCMALGNL
jgi:hypothetical protein